MKILASFRRMKQSGESFKAILLYWLPEIISSTVLFSLAPIIDSYLIASLGSLSTYGALGMTSNFLHLLIKFAEAIPVAAMAIIGRHNGSEQFEECGKDLGDTFWTTFTMGLAQFGIIFFMASSIFSWIGVPEKMIVVGTPFLKLKSFGVLLIFSSLAFMGFMKAVKNTRVPMMIHITGISIFLFFDYALILGKFGLPKLGLTGSALATIIQYSTVNILSVAYILLNPEYKKYFSQVFFSVFRADRAKHLLSLSWPIMIDKASVASSYLWLSKMLAPMGKSVIVTYDIVKNLERFAFLPAIAFSQIIIFLVSNQLGAKKPEGAMSNVKKVLFLAAIFTTVSLLVLCANAHYFVSFFDPKNKLTDFASLTLQFISILVIFDFTQIVLAGALRGAGDVKTVMMGRFVSVFFFFVPISYAFSKMAIEDKAIKFLLIYGSYYLTTGIMGAIFLWRIKGRKWQRSIV